MIFEVEEEKECEEISESIDIASITLDDINDEDIDFDEGGEF